MPKKKTKKAKKKTRTTKPRKAKKTKVKKAKTKPRRKMPKKKAKKAKAMKKPAKKAKGTLQAKISKGPVPLGRVVHYYDRIGVGIVELKGTLRQGDTVGVKDGEQAFTQVADSMQIDHKAVTEAKKGQTIGLKVKEPVEKGALVLKM